MRSSSGFNRTSQSPSRYYTSQIPVQSQVVVCTKKLLPPTIPGPSYGHSQTNYYPQTSTSYLNPQVGTSNRSSSSHHGGSSRVGTQIPSYINNYVESRPIPYHSSSYSPQRPAQTSIRVVQAPPLAIATIANQLPPQVQTVFRQTNTIDGGFYNSNLFEQSAIQKQMNTTQFIKKLNNTNNIAEKENIQIETHLDRLRVYKKQNVERVFGRDITFECNYEPQKLFSTKEIRGFLVNGFQEFEKNLQQLESRFSGLESSFYHLLHRGDTPKDVFDRFLVTLDRRIEKFFESFDETVIQNRGLSNDYFDTNILRNDYEFWNFKTIVKQGILEVSNKLNDLFIQRDNSTYYDAQIIRTLETIIKLYQFLKSDLNAVLNKSVLKCGKILETTTYNYENGEVFNTLNFADFIQLDIAQLVSQYSEEFERTYPVLLNKKQIVAEKFHDILKEKSTHSQFDLKQLVRSVFSRERRKLYRIVYNAVVKNGINQNKLKFHIYINLRFLAEFYKLDIIHYLFKNRTIQQIVTSCTYK